MSHSTSDAVRTASKRTRKRLLMASVGIPAAMLSMAATATVIGATPALATCTQSSGTDTVSPGCPGPTTTPTPTPTATPSDGNSDDADSGVIETAPPATPTEALTDAPTDAAGTAADPAAPTDGDYNNGVSPDGLHCPPEGWYTPSTLYGKYLRGVGAVQSDGNNTSRNMSVTFTAQASATVGVSLSYKASVSVDVLIAKANAEWNIGLNASMTAGLSNSISTTVPPHSTINAEYGVWRRKFTGTTHYVYSDCAATSHAVTAYGPYRVGWYLWEG